jgi:hypothetical protein
MTLAEQLVLLALDPLRGKPAAGVVVSRLRRGTAAAILAELVLHHRLFAVGDRVAMADALPDYHPMLGEAGPLISRGGGPIAPGEAVRRVERGISDLVGRVRDSLVARDLIHHYRQAFFLHSYPLRSQQALDEVFAALHRVIDRNQAQLPDLALAAIVDCCGVAAARLSSEKQFLLRRSLHEAEERAGAPPELLAIRAIARAVEDLD